MTSVATISAPIVSAASASARPERSSDRPAATEVEIVRIAVLMAASLRGEAAAVVA
jgi:hypothetical protein